MAGAETKEIAQRLTVLNEGLARFPAGVPCPWPLARIFNELLKQSRKANEDDPILKSIRYLEEVVDAAPGMSNASTGTVRALIDQILLTLGQRVDGAQPTDAE